MKKVMILGMIVFVALMFLAGCAFRGAGVPEKKKAEYSGFMELKAGQWSETVMKGSQGTVKMRVELIENSPDLAKYQIITGEEEVSQIWYDKKKSRVSMYVLKSGDDVLCMDNSQAPTTYITSDDSSYPANKPEMESDVYTTPTGKEVVVGKFTGTSDEVWVSSEVPFGIVKIVINGQTTLQLYDFGIIGAKSQISAADLEHCAEKPIVEGYISEDIYDSMQDDPDLMTADDHDYETYIEEEKESEDSDISARTYDPTGDDVDLACAECDVMPPMAKNACLAACR